MKKRTALIIILLTFISVAASAREFDGYVRDYFSGKVVSDARISVEGSKQFTYTNALGYFILSVRGEKTTLIITATGFETRKVILDSNADDHLVISIQKTDYLKSEGITNDDYIPRSLSDPVSGHIKLSKDVAVDLPILGSEFDPVKSLQMLPGVEFGREGMAELFVRGGGARQNLYNLNGIPIYGDNHAFGFLSVYNMNDVNSIELYRGAFPARYGGRLSSVVDITSSYGNKNETSGYSYASPLTLGFGINGPIGEKDRTSFSLSGRRSYLDLLFYPAFASQGYVANFYDVQLNWETKYSDKTTLQFHSLFARDNYQIGLELQDSNGNVAETWDFGWHYTTAVVGARLNHAFDKTHFGSFSLGYSYYSPVNTLNINGTADGLNDPSAYDIKFYTGNFDIIASADMTWQKDRDNKVLYGAQITTHGFNTGRYQEESRNILGDVLNDVKLGDKLPSIGLEAAFYGEDEINFSQNVTGNIGARAVLYAYDGFVKPYIEPRAMFAFKWSTTSTLKLGYMRVNQFLHSLNNDGSSISMNRWIPSARQHEPGNSDQFNLSWVKHYFGSSEFHLEGYYKILRNLYLEQFAGSVSRWIDYSSSLYKGSGRSYGVELYLQKTMGVFTGYGSYGFAKTTRNFVEFNGEESFPFNFDRRHTLKLGGRLVVDEEYTVTLNIVVGSGLPYTLPNSIYRDINGELILGYESINNYRSNWYNRFDLGIIKSEYAWEEGGQRLTLSLYNMFATKNTNNVFLDKNSDSNQLLYDAYRSIVFVFIPGVHYEMNF